MTEAATIPAVAAPTLLGPAQGAFVADADALTRWASTARAGETCVYARLARLPRMATGAEQARTMSAAGLVCLFSQRTVDPALFDYRAQRTALCFGAPSANPPIDAALPTDEALLLDILSTHADLSLDCPSNADIAAVLGWRQPARVATLMARLRAIGAIDMQWFGAPPWRQVTILSTGAATAGLRFTGRP